MGDFTTQKGRCGVKGDNSALLCCAACAAILDKMGINWQPGEIVDAWEAVCCCCTFEVRRAILQVLRQGRAQNEMEVNIFENRIHVVS